MLASTEEDGEEEEEKELGQREDSEEEDDFQFSLRGGNDAGSATTVVSEASSFWQSWWPQQRRDANAVANGLAGRGRQLEQPDEKSAINRSKRNERRATRTQRKGKSEPQTLRLHSISSSSRGMVTAAAPHVKATFSVGRDTTPFGAEGRRRPNPCDSCSEEEALQAPCDFTLSSSDSTSSNERA